MAAFERKTEALSVGEAGEGIARLLDGRRKPPPVTDKDWFKADSEIRFAAALIAKARRHGRLHETT